jgi:hypothetical protein
MQDSSYTDPSIIRATYAARGRNAKLNVSKAESLGIHASSVSPTQGSNPSGGSGIATAGLGGASGGAVVDPTLYADPGTTFDGSTYQDTTYQEQQKIDQLNDASLF